MRMCMYLRVRVYAWVCSCMYCLLCMRLYESVFGYLFEYECVSSCV